MPPPRRGAQAFLLRTTTLTATENPGCGQHRIATLFFAARRLGGASPARLSPSPSGAICRFKYF